MHTQPIKTWSTCEQANCRLAELILSSFHEISVWSDVVRHSWFSVDLKVMKRETGCDVPLLHAFLVVQGDLKRECQLHFC
mmetsp:Transcript_60837/g.100606  ORF Transcript_60837/g.100606 Transcript_60837/m.100606 type:complete len:80 (+) Transcript_60837:2176-2415(+)